MEKNAKATKLQSKLYCVISLKRKKNKPLFNEQATMKQECLKQFPYVSYWVLLGTPWIDINTISILRWEFLIWRKVNQIVQHHTIYTEERSESENHSIVSDSLQPHGLYSPRNSPGQITGEGSLSLLQGIFPTQGLNPGLPHCRWILYQLSHQGSPN